MFSVYKPFVNELEKKNDHSSVGLCYNFLFSLKLSVVVSGFRN